MNRLRELRIKKNKTQADMAEFFHVNRTTFTKWENGEIEIRINTAVELSRYFNVSLDYLLGLSDFDSKPLTLDDIYNQLRPNDNNFVEVISLTKETTIAQTITYDEWEIINSIILKFNNNSKFSSEDIKLIKMIKKLDENAKSFLLKNTLSFADYTRYILDSKLDKTALNDEFIDTHSINQAKKNKREMPVFNQVASAGNGTSLFDSDSFETHWLYEDDVPRQADFGVRISGDSMNPAILDKDIVWVRRKSILENNSIGIFILNDDVLCKKYKVNHEKRKIFLISLNSKYKDIEVDEQKDDFKIVGEVIF